MFQLSKFRLSLKNVAFEFAYFKVNRKFKGALSGLRQFLATKNPVKMMKNAFYFTNLFSISRYLNFCLDFLVI